MLHRTFIFCRVLNELMIWSTWFFKVVKSATIDASGVATLNNGKSSHRSSKGRTSSIDGMGGIGGMINATKISFWMSKILCTKLCDFLNMFCQKYAIDFALWKSGLYNSFNTESLSVSICIKNYLRFQISWKAFLWD